jgi:hypothetical protein
MIYIVNAFSIQMLDRENINPLGKGLEFVPCSIGYVKDHMEEGLWVGAIGHIDTAAIVAQQLEVPVEKLHSRISVTMTERDTLLVAQYRGPRLPEGTQTLPEGARIEWWLVH